jgi:tight adherence protein C
MSDGVLAPGELLAAFSPAGALVGLLGGLGAALVWRRLPWRRRPGLDERLAPYLRDAVPASRLLALTAAPRSPLGTVELLLAPVMADAVRWVERMAGGAAGVRRRLDQLGDGRSVEQFRAEQVVWGVLGAVAGVALALTGVVAGSGGSVPQVLGLLLVGGFLGVLGRDQLLTTHVRRREQRILAEFPAVAELLALSVAAGEGAVGALERVSRTCSGELSAELRRTLADARAGACLVQALERLAARTNLPVLARFVDGVAVAIERGTPLGDVLRAQAQDVRELSRRRLIENGGRKEIAMMVPVVFLVLPITVLFAVFPGLAVLELNV